MLAAVFMRRLPSLGLGAVAVVLLLSPDIAARVGVTEHLNPITALLALPVVSDKLVVYYPVFPWLGVTSFGILFGRWMACDREQVKKISARISGRHAGGVCSGPFRQ